MKLHTLKQALLRLPIRWALTLWSAFLILVLFIAYNTVQYIFVEQWMLGQEKAQAQHKMNDILNGLLEREAGFTEEELPRIRSYLDKKNQNGQLIRVIDQYGNKVITVSDGIAQYAIPPLPNSKTEVIVASHGGHSLLVMRSPIVIHSFTGTVEIVKNIDQFKKLTEAILRVFLLCGLGAVVLSGLGGAMLARQVLKPIQAMARTMKDVERKGLQERMLIPDKEDELVALMKIFNGMMDQVERSFSQQSRFVEDASHELRTPIAIMDGHLSLLLRWGKEDPEALEESLSISYQELTRIKALVQDLLTLTRTEKAGSTEDEVTISADRTLLNLVGELEQLHPAYPFETLLTDLQDYELLVAERHLIQIMMILLDNAVKYSAAGSSISVAGYVRDQRAYFQVTDHGIGISEEDLPHVMERFYRADKARNREQGGTGLGLAIAKRLVDHHNGTIMIQSEASKGTTVTISFACRPCIDKREGNSL